jgi:hypothetical protein
MNLLSCALAAHHGSLEGQRLLVEQAVVVFFPALTRMRVLITRARSKVTLIVVALKRVAAALLPPLIQGSGEHAARAPADCTPLISSWHERRCALDAQVSVTATALIILSALVARRFLVAGIAAWCTLAAELLLARIARL